MLLQRRMKKSCMADTERPNKDEIVYAMRTMNGSLPKTFLSQKVRGLCPLKRLRAWNNALLASNLLVIIAVGKNLQRTLSQFSDEELGVPGRQLLCVPIEEWLNALATIQSMTFAEERHDAEHHDGGASCFHTVLSLWGPRTVSLQLYSGGNKGEKHVPRCGNLLHVSQRRRCVFRKHG